MLISGWGTILDVFSGGFFLCYSSSVFVKERAQAERYKSTLLSLIKSWDTNDTGLSLTVCTNIELVFTSHFYSPYLGPKLQWVAGNLDLKSTLKRFEADCFRWRLALCSDYAGFTGLTNRASVLASRIFANKWTVLTEFPSTICILNEAVSADAVPRHAITMQGAQPAALQWLLLAVTAINNSRDGWSGSVVQCINKYCKVHLADVQKQHTHGSRWLPLTPTMSQLTTHMHTQTMPVWCILNAWLL